MAFETNQCMGLRGPAADHPRQRGQQQVIDLRAVRRRDVLQQLPGQLDVQLGDHRQRVLLLLAAMRMITRQGIADVLQLRLPVDQLLLQRRALRVGLQVLGPAFQRAGFRRQQRWLA